MKLTAPRAFCAVALALLGTAWSWAQSAGSLAGRVTDANNNTPLPGVTVSTGADGRATATGRDGTFVLPLPAGEQAVTFEYLGYTAVTRTVAVAAGETARLDVALGSEVIELAAFKVEGAREGQARAINQQRAAVNIKNLVASDAIGNFPDASAGEALKRVPGVSMEIQRGEARTVTIRGAEPAFNSITLDGAAVAATTNDGRTVQLDTYSSDQLAGIEVTKAVTPDMDAASIGGSVNLVTKSAFEIGRRSVNANAFWVHNDQRDGNGYRGGFTYTDVLGADGGWGVQVFANRSLNQGQEDEPEAGSYNNATFTGGTAPAALIAGRNRWTSFAFDRTRTTYGLNLERKLGADSVLAFKVSYNEFLDEFDRAGFWFDGIGRVVASQPFEVRDGTYVKWTSNNARIQRDVQFRENVDEKFSYQLNLKSRIGEWDVKALAAYTDAAADSLVSRAEWRTGANQTVTFDLSQPYRWTSNTAVPADRYRTDLALRRFREVINDNAADEFTLQLDGERDVPVARGSLRVKTGWRSRFSGREFDGGEREASALTGGLPLPYNDSRLGPLFEYDDNYLGQGRFGPQISVASYRNALATLPLAWANLTTIDDDYTADEDVHAVYGMGTWKVGAATWLFGARYESTEATYRANKRTGTVFTPTRGTKKYDHFLPGAHFTYQFGKRLLLRAAWTNTIARPGFDRTAPIQTESATTLTGGNPALEPVESTNFDVSLEYYLPGAGVASVGYFHKDLSNAIYEDRRVGGAPGGLDFVTFFNAGDGRISGAEFNYVQDFRSLPAPFDGLGLNANFTLVDSSVDVPARPGESFTFFNQADSLGNVALTYQRGRLFARVSYNWRDGYLSGLGDPGRDSFRADLERVDAKLSFKLTAKLSLVLEGSNLTDEPDNGYIGVPTRWDSTRITGRYYGVGVTLNL